MDEFIQFLNDAASQYDKLLFIANYMSTQMQMTASPLRLHDFNHL